MGHACVTLKSETSPILDSHTCTYFLFTTRIFRERIQEVNFLGVSGRVHFKNGDRLANILVKQQFVSRYEVIGQFVHAKDINGSLPGHLQWDLSRIKWTTGQIPGDLLPGKLNAFIFVTRRLGGLWSSLASVAGTSTNFSFFAGRWSGGAWRG